MVEKSIDVLAQSLNFINDLEEICINESELRFNIPKNMGGVEGKVRVQTYVHCSIEEKTGAPERGS